MGLVFQLIKLCFFKLIRFNESDIIDRVDIADTIDTIERVDESEKFRLLSSTNVSS